MTQEKKLMRSNNKVIAGVCAGVAEYFGIDPTVVRVIWAILAFMDGIGILLYLAAVLIMPKAPAAPITETREESGKADIIVEVVEKEEKTETAEEKKEE